MIGIFESIVEIIEFREPLFDIPLVISNFELYAEEDGSFFCFVFGEAGYANFDS